MRRSCWFWYDWFLYALTALCSRAHYEPQSIVVESKHKLVTCWCQDSVGFSMNNFFALDIVQSKSLLVSQTFVWRDHWLLVHYWLLAFCIGRYLGSSVQRPRLKNLDLVYVCLYERVDLWFLFFLDWSSNSSPNWLSYIEFEFGLVNPSGGALYIMFENHVRSWPLLKNSLYTRGYMSRYLCIQM
jgi:hypothetical protein